MSKRNLKKPTEADVQEVELQPIPLDVGREDEVECENDDDSIQESKPTVRVCRSCGSSANLFKTKKHLTCIECCNLRPPKSEKQLEAFKKARERRQESILRRKQEIQEFENKAREELDNKIVSKAISIKKKMIKKNAELDEISDDDTPLEEVMKISRKSKVQSSKKATTIEQEVEPPPKRKQPTQQPVKQQIQQPQPQPQTRTFNFL